MVVARGLAKYIEAFAEAEFDWSVLPHLDNDDLKELGLPLGARKKSCKASLSSALHHQK